MRTKIADVSPHAHHYSGNGEGHGCDIAAWHRPPFNLLGVDRGGRVGVFCGNNLSLGSDLDRLLGALDPGYQVDCYSLAYGYSNLGHARLESRFDPRGDREQGVNTWLQEI